MPQGTEVRPTPDRVRETVFNWLAGEIRGSTCLDLFAGTGALGLEALSRGAREAWLVETDAALARALGRLVDELGAEAHVVRTNADAFLRRAPQRHFDIAFVDPPYRRALEPLLGGLVDWLSDGARIYVERPYTRAGAAEIDALVTAIPGLTIARKSRAGGVAFALLSFRRP